MGEIKSIKCFNKEKFGKCSNLIVGAIVGNKRIMYYCTIKGKEIINPKGKRRCKKHEVRITKGILSEIDMRMEDKNGIYFRTNWTRGYFGVDYIVNCCHCCS